MKKLFVDILVAMVASLASVNAVTLSASETEATETVSTEDIIKIAKYIVQTPPPADPKDNELWQAAATALIMYVTDTKDFTLQIGNPVMETLEVSKNRDETATLMLVEMAGETIYILEHQQKESSAESFAAAMEDVLNIYAQMPTKSIKTLNKYLKMDKAKRQAEFIKLYNKKM